MTSVLALDPNNFGGSQNITSLNDALGNALDCAGRGWPVLLLHSVIDGRCTCGNRECNSQGKHPRTLHGVKDATTDERVIREWFRKNPDSNYGIATGQQAGIIVVDVDKQHDGADYLEDLERDNGKLPDTWTVNTGGGGTHMFFEHPREAIGNSSLCIGVDIRSDGGYVVGVGSIHKSGRTYEWEGLSSPDTIPLAKMPAWVVEKLLRRSSFREPSRVNDIIPDGQRNTTLASLAGSMRHRGMTLEAIDAALQATNAAQCNPPLPAAEVHAIAVSISRYTPSDLTPASEGAIDSNLALTELGNTRRIVQHYGENLLYNPQLGRFLVWDGSRYVVDEDGEVERLAKQIPEILAKEALSAGDTDIGAPIRGWAKKSQSKERIRAAVELLKTEPGLPVTFDSLDSDPMKLNAQNGTINLNSGGLEPFNRGDLITKQIPVIFDAQATCPRWHQCLKEIFDHNDEVIEYFQKAVGYSLTGDTSERVMFMLWGTGSNGKSVLLDTLITLLGDYSKTTPTSTLIRKPEGGVPNDIARLVGSRFVSASEAEEDQRLAESLIKRLVGGSDRITARFMRQEFFEFNPTFKIWIATNYRPQARGDDSAIWTRIRLIPFKVVFPPEKQDRQLGDKLKAELPGILNWAIEGCLKWQRNGLDAPNDVKMATEAYRAENDPVQGFIDDCCILGDDFNCSNSELWDAFSSWIILNGENKSFSRRAFKARLEQLGCVQYRISTGRRWRGIGCVSALEAEREEVY